MIEATYIDHMGSDLSVVNAARVSFGKESEFEDKCFNCGGLALRKYQGVDFLCTDCYIDIPVNRLILKEKDTKLIRYLAKHKHISPFGHAFASFHVKAPVFVARQLVKHSFLRWNEISRRYVDEDPEFYVPDVWRGRSEDKKQGSEGVIEDIDPDVANSMVSCAKHDYKYLLSKGVSPEQARMILPQSMMTEWYWSGSLDAFARMCNLRCKPDTQAETREVANQIDRAMLDLFPVSWDALTDDDE
jgi:thymidylate synthase (FAD)